MNESKPIENGRSAVRLDRADFIKLFLQAAGLAAAVLIWYGATKSDMVALKVGQEKSEVRMMRIEDKVDAARGDIERIKGRMDQQDRNGKP